MINENIKISFLLINQSRMCVCVCVCGRLEDIGTENIYPVIGQTSGSMKFSVD